MRNHFIKALSKCATCLSMIALTNCGGIDGSGAPIDVSVSGPISGFGSVIVNGVHYDTENASIYVRGELSVEEALDVGDHVVVVGQLLSNGDAIATEVHYQPRVTGLIEAIDIDRNQLTVMGQTVQLVEDTVFSSEIMPRNIDGFTVGRKVTVSGVADSDNVIRASRIEISESSDFELLGAVEMVDAKSQVFHIDGTKVDYSGIGMIGSMLEEGRLVIVSGNWVDNETLAATKVDFNLDYRKLQEVETVELTGLARNINTESGSFDIDTLPVVYNADTQFVGGEIVDLEDNVKVKVTGKVYADGRLLAATIEIIPTPDMQVYGELQSLVPASFGSPYWGTVQVQDHVFWVTFDTRFTGENEERISFFDLRVGDSVYVSAYADPVGNLYSASIAVDNRQFENLTYEIQGFVYAPVADQKSFSIFNTRVVTDENTVFTDGYQQFDEETFYALLTNQYVQVLGYFDFSKYVMVATRVTYVYPWTVVPVQ